MQPILQLGLIVATLVTMVALALTVHLHKTGERPHEFVALIALVLSVLALVCIFRKDKQRLKKETEYLEHEVEMQAEEAFSAKHYRLMVSIGRVIAVFLTLVIFGVVSVWAVSGTSPLPIKIGATGLILFLLYGFSQAKKLLNNPIVEINTDGVRHYILGEIPWKEVTQISLRSITVKGQTNYDLSLRVIDDQKYRKRLLLNIGHVDKMKVLHLALPTSKLNACIVGAVAEKFAAYAKAPTISTKLAEAQQLSKEIVELSKLEPIPQNQEKLINALQQQLQAHEIITSTLEQRTLESKQLLRKNLWGLFLGCVVMAIFIWIKLS